jgi:hypothetical protein
MIFFDYEINDGEKSNKSHNNCNREPYSLFCFEIYVWTFEILPHFEYPFCGLTRYKQRQIFYLRSYAEIFFSWTLCNLKCRLLNIIQKIQVFRTCHSVEVSCKPTACTVLDFAPKHSIKLRVCNVLKFYFFFFSVFVTCVSPRFFFYSFFQSCSVS